MGYYLPARPYSYSDASEAVVGRWMGSETPGLVTNYTVSDEEDGDDGGDAHVDVLPVRNGSSAGSGGAAAGGGSVAPAIVDDADELSDEEASRMRAFESGNYKIEIETKETLKRERTRIQNQREVNVRRIDYRELSNIKHLRKGGFGEIHTAEWSRLKVVLKRVLVDNKDALDQFSQE
ncbi:hypothetical protein BGZ73_001868, partial [Actinomortierella ambigua]